MEVAYDDEVTEEYVRRMDEMLAPEWATGEWEIVEAES